ncbi:hypothetical protein ACFV23_20690, partial [Streptomyces sp. NPDC059627]
VDWPGRETLDPPSRYPAVRSAGTVLAVRGLVGLDAADLLADAGVGGPRVTWQLRADLSGGGGGPPPPHRAGGGGGHRRDGGAPRGGGW